MSRRTDFSTQFILYQAILTNNWLLLIISQTFKRNMRLLKGAYKLSRICVLDYCNSSSYKELLQQAASKIYKVFCCMLCCINTIIQRRHDRGNTSLLLQTWNDYFCFYNFALTDRRNFCSLNHRVKLLLEEIRVEVVTKIHRSERTLRTAWNSVQSGQSSNILCSYNFGGFSYGVILCCISENHIAIPQVA